jgi:hypothetical protein
MALPGRAVKPGRTPPGRLSAARPYLTAWPTVQGDLEQAGAKVKDEPVVIDQNWITSR